MMVRSVNELSRRDFLYVTGMALSVLGLVSCLPPSAYEVGPISEKILDKVQPEYVDSDASSYNFLTTANDVRAFIGNEVMEYIDDGEVGQIGGKSIHEQGNGTTTTVLHQIGTQNFVVIADDREYGRQLYSISETEAVRALIGNGAISAVQPLKGGAVQVFFERSNVSSIVITDTGDTNLDRSFLTQGRMTSDRRAIISANGVVTIAEDGHSRRVILANYDERVLARNALFVNENEPMVVVANNKVIYPVRRSGEEGIVLGIQSLEITRKPDQDVRLTMTAGKLEKIGLPVRHVTNRLELDRMGMGSVSGEEVYAAIYLGDPDGKYYPWVQLTESEVYEHNLYFT